MLAPGPDDDAMEVPCVIVVQFSINLSVSCSLYRGHRFSHNYKASDNADASEITATVQFRDELITQLAINDKSFMLIQNTENKNNHIFGEGNKRKKKKNGMKQLEMRMK